MQLYLEEQVKFYETVKAFASNHLSQQIGAFVAFITCCHIKPSHDHPSVFVFTWAFLVYQQIAAKLRQAHSQFTTM